MREELAQAYAKPETFQGYTAETGQQLEALANTGAYDIVPQYGPAGEGQAQGAFTGYRAVPKAGLDLQGDMPAAPMAFNPQQVQDYGGRRVAGQFDPAQLRGLQMREAAGVLGRYGDVRGAATLEAQAEDFTARAEDRAYQAQRRPLELQDLQGRISGQAQQRDVTAATLRGLGRTEARETGFDAAITEINKTDFATPAERNTAVLKAVTQFKGPEVAAQLEANYSTNERNKILTDGAKFDQTIKQARLKGPAAALKAIDDLNDSFKLEIDGFKVTQVNNDGTRVPFLQGKNADEFALLVDSRIRDGGAFELAKFRQDEQTNTARVEYFKSMTEKAKREGGAAANQLSGVQLGYSRDPNGNPIQVMSAMRFNKRTGDLESVQVPLQQNVVPASALDPKKIAEQAEALVGQPIDPTNKKSKVVYTFATAQQAVVDQIFNQYLGTGGPADGVAKSDAQRILDQQKRPAGAAPASVGLSTQGQQATVPTERPTRRAGESFTDFRNRTVAWDENRMAYEQQMRNEELQRRLGANVTGLMNRPLTQ
jgi:hypothetical protein